MTLRFALVGMVGAAVAAAGGALAAADAKKDVPANPTFTKDVLPIFEKSCQDCHRPGPMAPFSLISYEEARPWA